MTTRMEQITYERVIGPLVDEHVVRKVDVQIVTTPAVGPEPWTLLATHGRHIGGNEGGRILITLGELLDPLAGLVWFSEGGQFYVSHVWVDADARGHGLSCLLFDAYRSIITPQLRVVGPFTAAGRAAAERAGAILIED